ncbi:zinc finger protein 654-like isoform X2 [Periophthalmus magnuspinnatus]|uniref:zinc finger protein 654-like isoform X2 n=1 Tax=Periophthalmus magnuspinnatus TaxID=409849 RepID=UPI0024372F11|nr:zinc finger protein 654-like isoform X2 [Periophthalmus magnuspinnatus]
MADSESDLETDGLDLALETLCSTHCTEESFLNSKAYCSAFCELVEEYTGQWHVPLPQLKVLRTALCSFTKATAAFPDDCQHVHYVLSSLALSFFELLLFFSKEEYGEQPLKDIFDSFLECHSQLLRHRNIYLHHVKLTLKSGGPWENPILQGILKEAVVLQKQVEEYLSSELPVLLELRVRYLQACERLQEAMALCKCCLENQEMGKHLFFHQAYLTCLYKSSLHEHLLKEMAEIDGRDAVEIICNTENVEKDEVLLSLCKTFLTQQLQNGDMYYIWDLVFIWSRLYLRAHPSRHEFLSECLRLSSSATNVRAIFPFIKLVHTELGEEGIQVCVELCARALQLCNLHSDAVTRSLVCKTIAFLLPHDLEMCRACALLVFCQERSLEAYHTVCSLYKHPDDELHPHNSPVRTCIRFHILQKLKEHLCFDPEFWNLLTLRTHCLELISDKAMQAAVLNEIEEEEKYCEAQAAYNCADEPHLGEQECLKFFEHSENVNGPNENTDSQKVKPLTETENVPKRRRGRRRKDEMKKETEKAVNEGTNTGDDPEAVYDIKPNYSSKSNSYSLRRNHKNRENAAPVKFPFNRKREYLTRCVKSQLLTRKGHKRWLQGVQTLDREEYLKVKKIMYKGKKRGRKPFYRVELSYPDNEIQRVIEMESEESIIASSEEKGIQSISDNSNQAGNTAEEKLEKSQTVPDTSPSKEDHSVLVPAVEGDPELDGPPYELMDSAVEVFHNYCLDPDKAEDEEEQTKDTTKSKESAKFKDGAKSKDSTKSRDTPKLTENAEVPEQPNGIEETKLSADTEETKSYLEVKGRSAWQERLLRTQKYSHIIHSCEFCNKTYRGLNVMRHALSHMKKKRKHCILCGQRFREFSVASKHIKEHIEEMSKQKPGGDSKTSEDSKTNETNEENHIGKPNDDSIEEKKATPESDTSQQTPTANGTEIPSLPVPLDDGLKEDENLKPSETKDSKSTSKPKPCRFKFTELKREERIARHVLNLFKKRYVFSKFNQNIIPRDFVLSEEQVVIDGDLVILKNVPMRQEGVNGENEKMDTSVEKDKGEEAENLSEKEGKAEDSPEQRKNEGEKKEKDAADESKKKEMKGQFVSKDLVYYLCPGEDCDKVFYKIGHTMTKHAMKYHLNEEKIQEVIFKWSKQKCILCHRQFNLLPHFKDHLKLHLEHPQYFCCHQSCGQRFESFQELRNHEAQHVPLRPQCMYIACENVFNNIFALGDHEWRHYIPTPLKSDLETGPNKSKRHSEEAPWKQRVKVEELWLQNKNTPREEINLRQFDRAELNDSKNNDDSETCDDETNSKTINGYYEKTDPVPKQASLKHKIPPEPDPINVKNRSEDTTIASVCEASGPEVPLIEEHRTFKPNDPAYKPLFKAPLLRPPPSMYMTESELSMRKRKMEESTAAPVVKKTLPWNQRKKEPVVVETPEPTPEPEPKIRHRCEKCLSFFGSPEELNKHKSLNTCSALFGFDSDDES